MKKAASTSLRARRPALARSEVVQAPQSSWRLHLFSLFAIGTLLFSALCLCLSLLPGVSLNLWLLVAAAFVAYDAGIGAFLLWKVGSNPDCLRPRSKPKACDLPRVSVLIAARNEAHCIVDTLRGLFQQNGVEYEIIVANDGSTDDTGKVVARAYGLLQDRRKGCRWISLEGLPITLLNLEHSGKGGALNAAAGEAKNPILVTLDADTRPSPGAVARLAAAFLDPEVEAATGLLKVSVPRQANPLVNFQAPEYRKNSLWRLAWAMCGCLEQIPGAFGAMRATAFKKVGGFPTDSLVEDYEFLYRLYDVAAREKRWIKVAGVHDAEAFTDGPETMVGFVGQRTRWFAGFLSTLFRFRHLLLRPSTGAFGMLRLPLKCCDALFPLVGISSLCIFLASWLWGGPEIQRGALVLFIAKWAWDAIYAVPVLRWTRTSQTPRRESRHEFRTWVYAFLEPLGYVWFKQFAILRAYVWAVRRVRTWEDSRIKPGLVSSGTS